MRSRKFQALLATASSVALLAACNQILGIDEAAVDARLSPSNHEPSVLSGGSAGSAGSESVSTSGTDMGGSAGIDHSHMNHEDGGAPPSEGGTDGGPGPSQAGTQNGNGNGNGNGKGGSAGTGHTPSEAGASGEGGGGGDDEPKDLCETYCDELDDLCIGVAAQYRDRDQCLKICRMLPEGTSDEDANTVSCRLKYAEKARYGLGTEVNVYCTQAGPSSDGRCGSVCEGFCSLMGTVCTEESAGVYHFASDEDCRTACEALPPAGVAYSSSNPQISDGNHALCRLFHVTSAAMADPEEHCEHALGITLCEAPAQ